MPGPVKLDGTDEDTKILGTLVHWVMRNNLLTIVNKYSAIQASRDFDVSYRKLKRVITGKRQPRGLYYERLCREQEGKKSVRKRKAVNPVDTALAKKKKVTLSVDTTGCKFVVSCITQVKSSWSTLTRNTQVNKLSMLVRSVPNHLISIQSICST